MRYLTIIFLFITTFAIGQQQMFLRSTPAAGVTGILDSYTGAEAAYATALLYSGYSGSCLRVRRSDNTEQDIGFSGQDIDEAAINTFCSGANCFVKTWYDQSGNGNDATQTVAASQPKIYDSSTGIVYRNSVTAADFDGSDDFMSLAARISGSYAALWVVCNTDANLSTNSAPIAEVGSYTNVFANSYYFNGASTGFPMYDSYASSIRHQYDYPFPSGISVVNQHIYSVVDNGTSVRVARINGQSIDNTGTNVSYAVSGSLPLIGKDLESDSGFQDFDGKMQLIVIYAASDMTSSQTGVESAINNYYNIY
jgi:hypothetical protein